MAEALTSRRRSKAERVDQMGPPRPGMAERGLLAWSVVTTAGWCGFAWFRLWQATRAPSLVWQDSKSYMSVAGRAFWSLGFWAGERPPLVPLVWKLTGSPSSFVLAQTLVAVVAWGGLAWVVGRSAPPGWRRTVAAVAVLAFATSPPIVIWDRSVLSESLSLSLIAVLVASLFHVVARPTTVRGAAVIVSSLLVALTRDSQVWTVGLLGVGFAGFALVGVVRHRRLPRYPTVLAGALLVITGVAAWGVSASGRTVENVTDVLYVRVFPYPDRVEWFASHGMPQMGDVERLSRMQGTAVGVAKIVTFDSRDPRYARLERWIDRDGPGTYALWLASHPGYIVSEPLVRPERTFNNSQGDLLGYGGPGRVDSPVGRVMWPAWVWLIPILALAFSVSGTGMAPGGRRRQLQIVSLLCGLGLIAMLVAWHGDGQEVTRHTVEGFAQLRACVLILLIMAVTGERLSVRRPPGDVGRRLRAQMRSKFRASSQSVTV